MLRAGTATERAPSPTRLPGSVGTPVRWEELDETPNRPSMGRPRRRCRVRGGSTNDRHADRRCRGTGRDAATPGWTAARHRAPAPGRRAPRLRCGLRQGHGRPHGLPGAGADQREAAPAGGSSERHPGRRRLRPVQLAKRLPAAVIDRGQRADGRGRGRLQRPQCDLRPGHLPVGGGPAGVRLRLLLGGEPEWRGQPAAGQRRHQRLGRRGVAGYRHGVGHLPAVSHHPGRGQQRRPRPTSVPRSTAR